MIRKVLLYSLFILAGNAAFPANLLDRSEMVKKYGPVPSAILEPLERSDIISLYSIYLTFREKLGTAKVDSQHRDKACFAVQRVLKGAIDLFNQEHALPEQQICKIDHETVVGTDSPLYTGKYLKNVLRMADAKCRLSHYGDLAKDGIIYCGYHGTEPGVAKELRAVSGYTFVSDIWLHKELFIAGGTLIALFLLLLYHFRTRAGRGEL